MYTYNLGCHLAQGNERAFESWAKGRFLANQQITKVSIHRLLTVVDQGVSSYVIAFEFDSEETFKQFEEITVPKHVATINALYKGQVFVFQTSMVKI
jgi:hypothetical protein